MDINYFDLVVAIIILFLGLKGIINGFFKEVFGLIGIIGGIFVASRVGDEVGQILSDLIFKFENNAAISFTGFITTLLVFWLLMLGAGYIFKKLSSMSGLGPVDKLLGFIVGASKFFLIAAVIAHSAYNIKAIKSTIDPLLSNSVLFPILVETGSIIMKLDPIEISDDINQSITNQVDKAQKHIEKVVEKSAADRVDEIKQELQNSIPKKSEET